MLVVPPDGDADQRALERALQLATDSQAFASPNPTVGCVITGPRGEVLGEGAHRYDDRDHAEIVAIEAARAAGRRLGGATAYVTLEPCAHHGRTGPCAEALVAAGIARCVVATVDPNPLVSGQGRAKLRAAAVTVSLLEAHTPLAVRARRLNDAFAFSVQHGRPFITLKAALSLDGKLAPAQERRREGEPFWLTGSAARADVQQLRHHADVLLTGIGTVLADDPQLSDRTGRRRRRPLLRVILDSRLRLPLTSRVVREAAEDVLVFCNSDVARARVDAMERHRLKVVQVPALRSEEGLRSVLDDLHARQCRSVLVEAGAGLNGALFKENLADQVVLYYADCELGGDAVPFAAGGLSPYEVQQQLTSATRAAFVHGETEDVRVAGYLHDPWAGWP